MVDINYHKEILFVNGLFRNATNLSNDNYELKGKSFDGVQLIQNISNSDNDNNFFKIKTSFHTVN